MFIGAGNDRQFRDLAELLHLPGLAEDPDFVTNADRVVNRARLRRIIEASLVGCDRDGLAAELLSRGIPAAPVNTVNEALESDQVAFRNLVIREGNYTGPGVPVALSRTPGAFRSPPRRRGEDTGRILAEAGCPGELIARIAGTEGPGGPERTGRTERDERNNG